MFQYLPLLGEFEMLDSIWQFTVAGCIIYITIKLSIMRYDVDLNKEIINTMLMEWDKK